MILEFKRTRIDEDVIRYDFNVFSETSKKEYNCSIHVSNFEITDKSCDCNHGMYEIVKSNPTGKPCKHLTECLNLLKFIGVTK